MAQALSALQDRADNALLSAPLSAPRNAPPRAPISAVVALRGDLGAGKTTFTRHLLQALGVSGRIKSPTYAVLEPHEGRLASGAALPIAHFDFYRFRDPQEWEDAGFRDVFAAPGLKLCEWPCRAEGLLPAPDLQLVLEVAPQEQRHVTAQAGSALGQSLLQALRACWMPMTAASPGP